MIDPRKNWLRDRLLVPLCWLVGLLAPIAVGLIAPRVFPRAPWFVPWVCALPFVLSVIVVAEWLRKLVLPLLCEAS